MSTIIFLCGFFLILNALSLIYGYFKSGNAIPIYPSSNIYILIIVTLITIHLSYQEYNYFTTAIPEGTYMVPVHVSAYSDDNFYDELDSDMIAEIEINKESFEEGVFWFGTLNNLYLNEKPVSEDILFDDIDINLDNSREKFNFSEIIDIDYKNSEVELEVISDEIDHDCLDISIIDIWKSRSIADNIVIPAIILSSLITTLYEVRQNIGAYQQRKKDKHQVDKIRK